MNGIKISAGVILALFHDTNFSNSFIFTYGDSIDQGNSLGLTVIDSATFTADLQFLT